jgi:hypothetical protein
MWKAIEEIDKRYEVNEFGEIRNKDTLHILIPKLDKYGYHQIGLRKSGDRKKYWFRIHRLVAKYFIENKPTNWEELQVDHIDHNKLNNNVENLRFTTCQDNNLSRELNPWTTNKTTGELYITKYRNGYMIRINRKDYKKQEWFSRLEDAVIKRNTYICEISKL